MILAVEEGQPVVDASAIDLARLRSSSLYPAHLRSAPVGLAPPMALHAAARSAVGATASGVRRGVAGRSDAAPRATGPGCVQRSHA